MEMTMPKYRVYIRVNEENYITQIEGECSLSNLGDLTAPDIHKIDEGEDERYCHAQGRYLAKPILDMASGCYNYKYINGEIVEVAAEEKAEIVAEREAEAEKTRQEAERNSPQNRINELERTICEMDIANSEWQDEVENALCEMDKEE